MASSLPAPSLSHEAHSNAHEAYAAHHASPTPLGRLFRLLGENRADLVILVIYTIVTGLLALAVPLAAQALVNTVAAGLFVQPLVVLTGFVLVGLLLGGILRLLQLSLVELLQQRIFARVALTLAGRLPRIRNAALTGEYGPELVNRFFDVLTVQKTIAKLLLDGLTAVLSASVGLILVAFYSPFLLGFDLFILFFIVFVIVVLGIGGLRSSLAESVQKYQVANWLEELARCQTSFKVNGMVDYLVARADALVVGYLVARRRHFRVTWRQAAGSYLFQAVASAGVLAIGGWLVLNGKLTLGQLVAAQVVVLSVLASLEKLVNQAEQVYDLLTGLEKIGHVTDLPVEREDGKSLPEGSGGLSVTCRSVRFSYRPDMEILSGLDLTLLPGERVSLVGASGAGKSTLAALLCGLEEPSHGSIEIGEREVRTLRLDSLRRAVTLVGYNNEMFEGTIEENIVVGREHVTHEDIRCALDIAQLTPDLAKMPQGTRTQLVSGGQNLSRGQIQRLLIARAIVDRPRLLLLDEAFTGIDERTTMRILDGIFAPENDWTIIDISHDPEVVLRADTVHVLAEGRIVETGHPQELAARANSAFADLFPYLSQRLTQEKNVP